MGTAVTVIGDAVLDVHVVPTKRPRPGGDVPAEVRLDPGGQGANVAVRLARRGLEVRLVCALGADAAGGLLRERLAAEGVHVVDLGSPATGAVVVLLDASRERTMLSQRVPLGGRLASVAPPESGWLVVSGYLLLEGSARITGGGDAPRRALLGCSLDAGQAAGWLRAAGRLAPHLVVLNADEARVLCGEDLAPTTLATEVGERVAAIAVVTHAGGAAAALDGEVVEVAAGADGPTVDATGAGDAFAAGLIDGLAQGPWPPTRDLLERAMASGIALAAAVARVAGAQGRVPGEPTP